MRIGILLAVALAPLCRAEDWPKVTYRGKVRSVKWLERVYSAFRSKLAVVDGVVCDTQRQVDYTSNPKPFLIARIHGPIMKVVDGTTAIVRLNRKDTKHWLGNWVGQEPTKQGQVLVYVRFATAVPTATSVKMSVATLRLRDVDGKQLLECLEVDPPVRIQPTAPTKAEFAAAVNAGLPLVIYERRAKPIRSRGIARIALSEWKAKPLQ